MSQQPARRSALDAQAARRKERADWERRLEALAVAVLTALGERDGAVKDAEKRTGGGGAGDERRGDCRCARPSSGAAPGSRSER